MFLEESRHSFVLGFLPSGVRWASREFPRPLSLVAALNHPWNPLLHNSAARSLPPLPSPICVPRSACALSVNHTQHLSSQTPSRAAGFSRPGLWVLKAGRKPEPHPAQLAWDPSTGPFTHILRPTASDTWQISDFKHREHQCYPHEKDARVLSASER